MPRRKKVEYEEEEEEEPYYYGGAGSLQYGMDDYDDPTENMTPAEIAALADYVEGIRGGAYDDEEDDDDDSDYDEPSYIPPADPLYPGDFDDDDEE